MLAPGEPEARLRAERLRDGVPLQPDTWASLVRCAQGLGVPVPNRRRRHRGGVSGSHSARRYAEARGRILTAAARRVPLASIGQQARALSLWDGKRVVPGDEMQLALVLDLGVLDPLGGHARGIDRQAKADPPEPGSDDARMLAALQAAAFGLYRLRGPHAEGGAAAESFPDGEPVRIHDNFLGRQPPGRLFGARLAWPENEVAMTCGAVVPVDSRVLERLLLGLPPHARAGRAAPARDA